MPVKDEVKNYLTKLAQTYGLDAAALLSKAESDSEAAKLIDEGVMLRSDYSRNLNELPGRIQAAKQEYYTTEILPRWTERETLMQTLQSEKSTLQAKAAAYESLYGTLEGFKPGENGNGKPPANTWQISEAEFNKQVEQARNVGAQVAKELTWAASKYAAEIGGFFDVDAFEKHLMDGKYEGQQAVRRGYEDFVRPQLQAKAKTESEADVARRVQEGVQAELAKRGSSPIDTSAPNHRQSAFFKQPDAADARIADPATPAHVRDDLLRQEFLKDMGNTGLTSAIFTGG